MGWKSTETLTRAEAIRAIEEEALNLERLSDQTLAEVLEAIRGGELHGSNYTIVDGPKET